MANFYATHPNVRYYMNENAFENIDTPEKAYWLGFIYAEGGIDLSKAYKLVINQHPSRKFRLEQFRDFLESNIPIKEYPHYKDKRVTIRVCRKKIVQDLARHGVVPRKSAILVFPDIHEKYYGDFIRGFFDGDGSLGIQKSKYYNYRNGRRKRLTVNKQLTFSLYSQALNFLKTIRRILAKRCRVHLTKIMQTGKKDSHVYCLRYTGNTQVPRILNYLSIQEVT